MVASPASTTSSSGYGDDATVVAHTQIIMSTFILPTCLTCAEAPCSPMPPHNYVDADDRRAFSPSEKRSAVGKTKKKQVKFNPVAKVLLIPTREDLCDFKDDIWTQDKEFKTIKASSKDEIKALLSLNPSLSITDMFTILYQPHSMLSSSFLTCLIIDPHGSRHMNIIRLELSRKYPGRHIVLQVASTLQEAIKKVSASLQYDVIVNIVDAAGAASAQASREHIPRLLKVHYGGEHSTRHARRDAERGTSVAGDSGGACCFLLLAWLVVIIMLLDMESKRSQQQTEDISSILKH